MNENRIMVQTARAVIMGPSKLLGWWNKTSEKYRVKNFFVAVVVGTDSVLKSWGHAS